MNPHFTAPSADRNAERRDWRAEAERFAALMPAEREAELAAAACTSIACIRAFGIGWSGADEAYVAPMQSAAAEVTGLFLWRLDRSTDVLGRAGLVLPAMFDPATSRGRRLVFATTVGDTLALSSLGVEVIGAPAPLLARDALVGFQAKHQPAETILLPAGDLADLRRAGSMEAVLQAFRGTTRLVYLPVGIVDFVAWKRHGVTKEDIVAAIDAIQPRVLSIVAARAEKYESN